MYRTQPVNVLDVIGGYQNIGLRNQQKQQNALELQQAQAMAQEKQRALAEMMDVKNVLAGAGGSREEAVRALEAKGYYKPADELRKAAAEDAYKRAQTEHVGSQMKKEEAETQVKQQETLSKRLTQYKDFLGMLKTPQDAVTWVSAQYNDPITKDFVSKVPMDQMIQSIPQTPAEFEAWRNETGMGIEKFVQNKTTIRGQDLTAQTSRENNAATNATSAANNKATVGLGYARLAEDKAENQRKREDKNKEDADPGKYTQVIIDPDKGPMLADRKNGTFKPLKGPSGETLEGKNVTAAKKLESQLAIGIEEARKLIPIATGSGAGRLVDAATSFVGKETEGDNASTQLETLAGWMTSNVPRMQGPQSDKDTLLYKQMAAQVGDRTKTRAARLKALDTLEALQKKYAGASDAVPAGIDPEDWKHMTPQERALWKK